MPATRRARIAEYLRQRGDGDPRRRLHRPSAAAAPAPRQELRRTAGGGLVVNLVSRDNGVGLSTDMDLLEDLFTSAGHDVERVNWTGSGMRRCHVAFFLELVNPKLFRHADATVGVLNLEWFPARWRRHLPRFSQLWAKSGEAYDALQRLGLPVRRTGFASRDLHTPVPRRDLSCLHLRGHSAAKNTPAVLEAWRRCWDLPPLIVVSQEPVMHPPPGVTVLPRVTDQELTRLLNTCSIHVCPSRAEGWGHYITEGLSTGALVVTVDASPMNEHVRPEFGFLLPPTQSRPRDLALEHDVDPDDIAAAVREAAALPAATRTAMGAQARTHVAARNAAFRETALKLLGEL